MDATKARNLADVPFDSAALDAARRWKRLIMNSARAEQMNSARAELYHQRARDNAAGYQRNIEAYIGTVDIPVGLAGPLRIKGRQRLKDYQVPLATTEAALVASYNRGSRLITAAGGCNARVLDQAVSRTPTTTRSSWSGATGFRGSGRAPSSSCWMPRVRWKR